VNPEFLAFPASRLISACAARQQNERNLIYVNDKKSDVAG
jgi:hypothetical protein